MLSRRKPPNIEQASTAAFGTFHVGAVSQWFIDQIAKGGNGFLARRIRLLGRDRMRRSREIADVTYRGLRLRLYPGENTCDMQICLYKSHAEEDEFEAFEQEITGANVFVDIGANVGLYSLIAAKNMAAEGKIISFEPDPRTVLKLQKNAELNDAHRVTVINKAVGPTEGSLPLYSVSWKNAGRNSLLSDIGKRRPSTIVPIVPLYAELEQQGVESIDVLKIDVEGFEDQAILPFFEQAPQSAWPKYIMIEIVLSKHWAKDVVQELKKLGYSECFRNGGNVHLRR